MQLLGLVKDEQGLPAALQGLADLPLQLDLCSSREVSGTPGMPWDNPAKHYYCSLSSHPAGQGREQEEQRQENE